MSKLSSSHVLRRLLWHRPGQAAPLLGARGLGARGLGTRLLVSLAVSSSSSSMSLGNSRRWYSSSQRLLSTSSSSSSDSDSDDDSAGNIPFLLADIGEGIKEVELLQWYCQAGDSIQQFDKVCEVQSDKATVEITSRFDGVVAALAGNVGDMLQVGQPLLYMQSSTTSTGSGSGSGRSGNDSDSDGTIAAAGEDDTLHDTQTEPLDDRLSIPTIASQFHLESDNDDTDSTGTGTGTGSKSSANYSGAGAGGANASNKFLTSPAVRKLGREYGLDLSTIHGSGPQGRLLKSDVLTYLQEQGYVKSLSSSLSSSSSRNNDKSTSSSTKTTPLSPTSSTPSTASAMTPSKDGTQQEDDEIYTLRGYSRLMVGRMTAALEIPHMGFGDELEVGKLLQCRRDLKEGAGVHGHNISILAFLIKACSLALTQYPICNAIVHDLDQCQLQILSHHDLGIAMDTPRGLVVPVIRNVQTKSLGDIQHDLDRLKALAATSKLGPDDLTTPTFTLSNIGSMGGGTYMSPVIVPPQLAMGAFGKVQRVPRFIAVGGGGHTSNNVGNSDDLQVYAAHIMNVSWAGDHRFLDGATLARFHAAFKEYVENPVHMLVHLK